MKMQRKWTRTLVRAAVLRVRKTGRTRRAGVPIALSALVGATVIGGGGPAWVVKSRNLKFENVFAELWTWIQDQWSQVLPIIVVAVVLGIIVALIKTAHGRHEGQGSIGRLVVAGIAALFMAGLVG